MPRESETFGQQQGVDKITTQDERHGSAQPIVEFHERYLCDFQGGIESRAVRDGCDALDRVAAPDVGPRNDEKPDGRENHDQILHGSQLAARS